MTLSPADLADASASQLLALYRAGQASPVEATRAVLARIARLNPVLNAFCLVDEEAALASARAAWESGRGQFRDVFEARQMLVAAELAQARATVEQYTQLTDLMFRGGFEDFAAFNPFVPESETSIQPAQTTNP